MDKKEVNQYSNRLDNNEINKYLIIAKQGIEEFLLKDKKNIREEIYESVKKTYPKNFRNGLIVNMLIYFLQMQRRV